ncbi:hypothetical protein [Cryobacterium sp. GrIS_2_6]|uniref:hypothetical protein n=1 Tax=Cryobacterium sp. GrIS_2_6 TaxID=3162785 RepID=UPI002DFD12C5|nr:hypothetical protein [Cryobacterium psychrotolerans]
MSPESHYLPARTSRRSGGRLVLLLLSGFALLAGLDGALLLLGLPAPVIAARLADVHGPLMVFGFVGTVVVLERAVAIRRTWAFLSPGLLGAGGIALMSPIPLFVGQIALVAGSIVLLAIYRSIWARQPSTSSAVQALGALLGLAATILWWGRVPVPHLIPAMTLFLVLTIAGERLELARISPTVDERAERWLLAAALALASGVVLALLWPVLGYPVLGLALLGLVSWLLRYDVATRLVRSKGLPRYMALCLLAGYGWLGVVGLVWILLGPGYVGPAYDAVVHSVFLGFVISMIMAHAPTIPPAVLRRPLPYRPLMYGPVVLLHASLLVRVVGGDARGLDVLVQWGGLANIVAVLLFAGVSVVSVLVGAPPKPARRPSSTASPRGRATISLGTRR